MSSITISCTWIYFNSLTLGPGSGLSFSLPVSSYMFGAASDVDGEVVDKESEVSSQESCQVGVFVLWMGPIVGHLVLKQCNDKN